jgi:hypothetical protein
MEINEKLNYVFVTKDPVLEKKLSVAFTVYESYVSLKSYDTLQVYLEHKKVDCIVFDEIVLTDIGSTKSNLELLQEVYNKTLLKNHKTIFILLAKKASSLPRELKKKSYATIYFNRDHLTATKLHFTVALLLRRKFRTILTKDLMKLENSPTDLFFQKPGENETYMQFTHAGGIIDKAKLDKINAMGIYHAFVRDEDLYSLIDGRILTISSGINNIRKKIKLVFSLLIDDFNQGLPSVGLEIKELATKAVREIKDLIALFPDHHAALNELIYPRWGRLPHHINSAIYILVLAQYAECKDVESMAIGALIHDIGLGEADSEITLERFETWDIYHKCEYEVHVSSTLDLLSRKMVALDKTSREVIADHHECFDGTGFPQGKIHKQVSKEASMLSFIDVLDHLRTEKNRTLEKCFEQVFKINHQSPLGQKFHPDIISGMEVFLKTGKIQLKKAS